MLVFVLPPSMAELERRLRERGTESEDAIRRRMLAARSEVEHGARAYDYLVVNDSVDRAYAELEAIVAAERCRRGRVDLAGARARGAAPRELTRRGRSLYLARPSQWSGDGRWAARRAGEVVGGWSLPRGTGVVWEGQDDNRIAVLGSSRG